MTPSLNAYQSEQLHAFMARHADEERIAADFGESPHNVFNLEWFPCEVPGMVVVKDENGFGMAMLYPTPRPVPRDPMFQHAEAISDFRRHLILLHVTRAFMRDWQTFDFMDAPDHFPAGSCEYMSASDEAYGATQTTCTREWWA